MKKNLTDFVTCGQMKILEQRADENGLSYYQMMENAGTRAAEIIMERYAYSRAFQEETAVGSQVAAAVAESAHLRVERSADVERPAGLGKSGALPHEDGNVSRPTHGDRNPKVMIFCGKGNNGGDGFVVARVMCRAGFDVAVILVDGEPKTEDSITNFRLLQDLPVKIVDMNRQERALMELRYDPDIIVDAMYGTGFRGKLRNNGLKAAAYINNRFAGTDHVILLKPAMVVALDIPSGLRGDMTNAKELDPLSVKAHYTVTFHARKPVHLQKFALEYCGEVLVADIGIDTEKLWGTGI